jgi:hypothetical protein
MAALAVPLQHIKHAEQQQQQRVLAAVDAIVCEEGAGSAQTNSRVQAAATSRQLDIAGRAWVTAASRPCFRTAADVSGPLWAF